MRAPRDWAGLGADCRRTQYRYRRYADRPNSPARLSYLFDKSASRLPARRVFYGRVIQVLDWLRLLLVGWFVGGVSACGWGRSVRHHALTKRTLFISANVIH